MKEADKELVIYCRYKVYKINRFGDTTSIYTEFGYFPFEWDEKDILEYLRNTEGYEENRYEIDILEDKEVKAPNNWKNEPIIKTEKRESLQLQRIELEFRQYFLAEQFVAGYKYGKDYHEIFKNPTYEEISSLETFNTLGEVRGILNIENG